MTYRQIETSREMRLWLGQIFIPAVTAAVSICAIPEVREAIATKARCVKQNIEQKMKRRES